MRPALRSRTAAPLVLPGDIPARVRPWPRRPAVAHLVVTDTGISPTAAQFTSWAEWLHARDFTAVRTGALGEVAAAAARRAGYRCVQELVLLQHDLDGFPHRARRRRTGRPAVVVRRAGQRTDAQLAEVDAAAFGDEWGLDELAVREVCEATPQHRLRVALHRGGSPSTGIGLAISGRAGRSGFLQRLAVHPHAQRRGLGTELVLDSLRWMRHRRVRRVLVNTHVGNDAAVELYLRTGFRLLPAHLGVYEWQP